MSALPPFPTAEAPLGPRIRMLRLARGLSLADLARATGVSEATMSRIETGQSVVSAPHLYGLAATLGVDLSTFFTDPATRMQPGVRSVTRAGQGGRYAGGRLEARLLHDDLLHKAMHPFVNRVTARRLDQAGGLSAHAGEEFLLVLEGELVLLSASYAPLCLHPGDSLYFDGREPHAYLAGSAAGAAFLVVSSVPPPPPET